MSYETDLAELKKVLFQDMKVSNFHFTPGPKATKESVVKELLKAMKALQNGDFEEVDFHDEANHPKVDITKLKETLS